MIMEETKQSSSIVACIAVFITAYIANQHSSVSSFGKSLR